MSKPMLVGLPDVVLTDIDGVWTDGGMYYDRHGNELKKFNTSDSAGVLFLRHLGIPVAILTGEATESVSSRAAKLQIQHVYQGVSNKVAVAKQLCESLGTSLERAAYMGDDLNDIQLLQRVGLSCCPANAPSYVQAVADVVTLRKGGEGAFREFVETTLARAEKLDEVIASVTNITEERNEWQ